jgi:hypothetical protein
VAGMIGNSELFLDQMGDSPAGPQRGLKTQPLGTLLEQFHQMLLIEGAEQRLAPGSAGFTERQLPSDQILFPPAAHRLVADLQPTAVSLLLNSSPNSFTALPAPGNRAVRLVDFPYQLEPAKPRKVPLYFAGLSKSLILSTFNGH